MHCHRETAEVRHHDHHDLLRGVLGVGRVAKHAQRQPIHRILHGLDHTAHRVSIAGRGGAHPRDQIVLGVVLGVSIIGELETSAFGFVTAACGDDCRLPAHTGLLFWIWLRSGIEAWAGKEWR